jgi:hypothetical protein
MSSLSSKIDNLMDAKYNAIMDSGLVRMTLVAAAFAVWVAGSVAVLKLV